MAALTGDLVGSIAEAYVFWCRRCSYRSWTYSKTDAQSALSDHLRIEHDMVVDYSAEVSKRTQVVAR